MGTGGDDGGMGLGDDMSADTGGVPDTGVSVGELMGMLWLFGEEAKECDKLGLDVDGRPVNERLAGWAVS